MLVKMHRSLWLSPKTVSSSSSSRNVAFKAAKMCDSVLERRSAVITRGVTEVGSSLGEEALEDLESNAGLHTYISPVMLWDAMTNLLI